MPDGVPAHPLPPRRREESLFPLGVALPGSRGHLDTEATFALMSCFPPGDTQPEAGGGQGPWGGSVRREGGIQLFQWPPGLRASPWDGRRWAFEAGLWVRGGQRLPTGEARSWVSLGVWLSRAVGWSVPPNSPAGVPPTAPPPKAALFGTGL